jgi:hypothetical protein
VDKISRILKTTHKVVVRASGGNSALTSPCEETVHVIDWLREKSPWIEMPCRQGIGYRDENEA